MPVSNARLIFSYTTKVIIVPGRTRIIEGTRLDVNDVLVGWGLPFVEALEAFYVEGFTDDVAG